MFQVPLCGCCFSRFIPRNGLRIKDEPLTLSVTVNLLRKDRDLPMISYKWQDCSCTPVVDDEYKKFSARILLDGAGYVTDTLDT